MRNPCWLVLLVWWSILGTAFAFAVTPLTDEELDEVAASGVPVILSDEEVENLSATGES